MQAHLSWQRSDDKDVYAELYRPYKHLIHPSINLTHINITYQLLLSSSPSHLSSSIENWRIHHSSPHQKLSNADLTNLEAGSWSKIRSDLQPIFGAQPRRSVFWRGINRSLWISSYKTPICRSEGDQWRSSSENLREDYIEERSRENDEQKLNE